MFGFETMGTRKAEVAGSGTTGWLCTVQPLLLSRFAFSTIPWAASGERDVGRSPSLQYACDFVGLYHGRKKFLMNQKKRSAVMHSNPSRRSKFQANLTGESAESCFRRDLAEC